MKGEIVHILNQFLPESYDREIFFTISRFLFLSFLNCDLSSSISSFDRSSSLPVSVIVYFLLNEAIDLTNAFCLNLNVDLSKVVESEDTFKNLSLFEDDANTIVGSIWLLHHLLH